MIERPVTPASPSRFASGAFLAWLAVTALWWGLAFAPLPAPAEWLARARTVCFGTLPNGLPDSYGWVLLLMGPGSMLAFLVAVWGRELVESARWAAGRAGGLVILAGLVLAPAAGALWVGQRVASGVALGQTPAWDDQLGPLPAAYPRGTTPAPDVELIDQRGAPFALADLRGREVLLGFAYAHCTTVCPVVVETVRGGALAAAGEQPAVVLVTLDPWRDTPRSLPGLAAAWRLPELADARVLSGAVDEVTAALAALEVPIERDLSSGDVFHPALVYVLDAEGRLAYKFLNPPVPWLAEAVGRLRRDRW